ncbi:replication factor C subunit 5 [Starmerella bacillaris]|uniref:Replication factor C subunit 5 n=1 Tax=Starmerella bacillaris TaxID=1247836 RepID=A0AAV5RPS2_STABA|nr:replication factor C subunit 5 [Starmerella bacillaris]
MSLWVHEFRPSNFAELDLNERLTDNLRQLCTEEELPHLLLYGPPGSGKQTRVGACLQELFGAGSRRIKIESRQLDAGGSKKLEITMVSSVYHVEITPSEAGNQDRFVVQELLKEIAQTQQIDQNAKHRYKVVVINEADHLTREAQAALRRTMEIYTSNLRIVMVATSLSPIMEPIRSRTLLVRVPAPSEDEIAKVLQSIAAAKRVSVQSDAVLHKIAATSQRNMRKAILMLEAMYAQNEQLTESAVVPLADWEAVIKKEAFEIVKSPTTSKLAEVRGTNYELLSHCIPPQIILRTLLLQILPLVDAKAAPGIIEAAALFDHRIRLGTKAIFHLEAFVARVMNVLSSR